MLTCFVGHILLQTSGNNIYLLFCLITFQKLSDQNFLHQDFLLADEQQECVMDAITKADTVSLNNRIIKTLSSHIRVLSSWNPTSIARNATKS